MDVTCSMYVELNGTCMLTFCRNISREVTNSEAQMWQHNFKSNLKEIWCKDVDWIELSQYIVKLWVFMNTVMKCQFPWRQGKCWRAKQPSSFEGWRCYMKLMQSQCRSGCIGVCVAPVAWGSVSLHNPHSAMGLSSWSVPHLLPPARGEQSHYSRILCFPSSTSRYSQVWKGRLSPLPSAPNRAH